MINWLKGEVKDITGSKITVNVNGVGYELICTQGLLNRINIGDVVEFTVYTDVKEDNISLFGFCDKLEKEVFILLKRIKGLGAKTAREILSQVDKIRLVRGIASGDLNFLCGLKGIGRKTAERIVVELREQISAHVNELSLASKVEREVFATEKANYVEDAIQAMIALGFAAQVAEEAVRKATADYNSIRDEGELVKLALKYV